MFEQSLAEQATHTADMALQTTQRAANHALDSVSNTMHRGMDTVNDASRNLRNSALRISDSTASHIRQEPIKSVLIAAAIGAALMALIGLMNRPRNPG